MIWQTHTHRPVFMARPTVAAVLFALTLVFPHSQTFAAPDPASSHAVLTQTAANEGELSDFQAIGYGCILGAAALMAITAVVGPVEVVQIFAGGALVPSSSLVLWTSLTMGAGAQTCTAAGLATPALIHAWGNLHDYWSGALLAWPGSER